MNEWQKIKLVAADFRLYTTEWPPQIVGTMAFVSWIESLET